MTIELSNEEADMLKQLLGTFISDVREEIYHTETTDFRADLKRQKEAAKRLLGKFETQAA